MDYKIAIVISILAFMGIMFMYYEKKKTSLVEVSLVATMAALSGVFRVPFAFLPNIQPTTFMVICCGAVFGPMFGFMVGSLSAVVSNTFLGHGPWTPWQMLSWGLAGMSAGFFSGIIERRGRIFLAFFCAAWGFLFGWIMNLWHWMFFIYPLNMRTFISVNVMSLYFDFLHAIGNFTFAFVAGKDLICVLGRFKRRLSLYGEEDIV